VRGKRKAGINESVLIVSNEELKKNRARIEIQPVLKSNIL
jgi:hypothetical protein